MRTIVPHTVEEAYEVADAALADRPDKLLDELGDLLFQVYFLALLLQEQGEGDLEQAARGIQAKLIARHPHVFGDAEARTAERVRERWAAEGRAEGRTGIFHDVPATLPRFCRRARCSGAPSPLGSSTPTSQERSKTCTASSQSWRPSSPAARSLRRSGLPTSGSRTSSAICSLPPSTSRDG